MNRTRRLLDDVAKVTTAAAGLAQGASREAETLLRQRLQRLLDRMDLVTREEFDAVKEMAARARAESEALAARVAALESTPPPADATQPAPVRRRRRRSRRDDAD